MLLMIMIDIPLENNILVMLFVQNNVLSLYWSKHNATLMLTYHYWENNTFVILLVEANVLVYKIRRRASRSEVRPRFDARRAWATLGAMCPAKDSPNMKNLKKKTYSSNDSCACRHVRRHVCKYERGHVGGHVCRCVCGAYI